VLVVLLVVVGGVSIGILGGRSSAEVLDSVPFTKVEQGYLPVEIEERGAVFDMKPLEVMNEVEGWTTLLEIVDQGTIITQEDVDNGMVLVKFDTAELEEEENDRSIDVYEAEASYTQAKEALDIQIKQNESDIAAAELKVRFARMDLDKYLGAELAALALEQGLEAINIRQRALQETQLILGRELCMEVFGQVCEEQVSEDRIALGGEARQRLRKLSSDVQLKKLDLTKAANSLTSSRQLAAEDYISRSELERDELSVQGLTVELQKAKENLRLFRRFELPKEAERLFSDCSEFKRDYERVLARTRSELAQKEARLKSRERSLALEKSRLEKVRESLEKAIIRAPKAGTVVYGSNRDSRYDDPVSAGSSVQEGKVILRIPDVKSLSVRVNINEKFKDWVKPGQKALISVEALPGKLLQGRVAKISPMASTTQARLNPDDKVYETEIALLTPPDRFIPGMSATARIIVAELEDALYLPVQAVLKESGAQAVWLKTPNGPEPRLVETGYLAGKYIEITAGLQEGELVYLAPPEERDDEKLAELIAQAEEARGEEGGWGGRGGEEAEDFGDEAFGDEDFASGGSDDQSGGGDWSRSEGRSGGGTASEGGRRSGGGRGGRGGGRGRRGGRGSRPEGAEGGGRPERPAGEPDAAPAADGAQGDEATSEYMNGDQIDWPKVGAAMQGLQGEEAGKKWQEILDSLPEEARTQAEAMARQRQGGGADGAQ
jgi:RND family efflux transporter MFP subunit